MAASARARWRRNAQLGALLMLGTACFATTDASLGNVASHEPPPAANNQEDEPLFDPQPAVDAGFGELDAGLAQIDAGHELDAGHDAGPSDAGHELDASEAGDAAHEAGHCREPWEPWECHDR